MRVVYENSLHIKNKASMLNGMVIFAISIIASLVFSGAKEIIIKGFDVDEIIPAGLLLFMVYFWYHNFSLFINLYPEIVINDYGIIVKLNKNLRNKLIRIRWKDIKIIKDHSYIGITGITQATEIVLVDLDSIPMSLYHFLMNVDSDYPSVFISDGLENYADFVEQITEKTQSMLVD